MRSEQITPLADNRIFNKDAAALAHRGEDAEDRRRCF